MTSPLRVELCLARTGPSVTTTGSGSSLFKYDMDLGLLGMRDEIARPISSSSYATVLACLSTCQEVLGLDVVLAPNLVACPSSCRLGATGSTNFPADAVCCGIPGTTLTLSLFPIDSRCRSTLRGLASLMSGNCDTGLVGKAVGRVVGGGGVYDCLADICGRSMAGRSSCFACCATMRRAFRSSRSRMTNSRRRCSSTGSTGSDCADNLDCIMLDLSYGDQVGIYRTRAIVSGGYYAVLRIYP